MTYFVETVQFKQMISYNPYVTEQNEKKKVKYGLLDQIKMGIGDKWDRLKEGTRQAFDMVCFLSAELGFFYASDDYLAERHDISDRTIRNRMRELEELGQVVKVHRRTKRCNGRGKPVYLFVNHPYFNYWVNLLGINTEFLTDFQTENVETLSESKEEGAKKVSTYSLPLKQEKNNIHSSIIHEDKIVQYVSNRIKDTRKNGTMITYLSSYVDRIVRSLERQALLAENARIEKDKKKREEERKQLAIELGIIKGSEPGFNDGQVSNAFRESYYYWQE